jgi:hypothetical protein
MSFSQRSQWALWLGKGSLMQEIKCNCHFQRAIAIDIVPEG